MKNFLAFTLILFAACFTTAKAQNIKLPAECQKILKGEFSSYRPAQVSQEFQINHQAGKHSYEPNLVKGDWNGDGKIDYAVLIERKQILNGNSPKSLTVAFLRNSNGYRHYILEGGDYIDLMKKGEKDYSYDWQRNFRYKNDAIFVGIGECCGSSYVWRNGKFISTVTSD